MSSIESSPGKIQDRPLSEREVKTIESLTNTLQKTLPMFAVGATPKIEFVELVGNTGNYYFDLYDPSTSYPGDALTNSKDSLSISFNGDKLMIMVTSISEKTSEEISEKMKSTGLEELKTPSPGSLLYNLIEKVARENGYKFIEINQVNPYDPRLSALLSIVGFKPVMSKGLKTRNMIKKLD